MEKGILVIWRVLRGEEGGEMGMCWGVRGGGVGWCGLRVLVVWGGEGRGWG